MAVVWILQDCRLAGILSFSLSVFTKCYDNRNMIAVSLPKAILQFHVTIFILYKNNQYI
jgi:hypothetical protein